MSENVENEAEVVSRALIAIVDIGSNGIRFSISSKLPHHARIMPCVFKDRIGISLFDAQLPSDDNDDLDGMGFKQPIPQSTIEDVIFAMKRFKLICDDFGVPPLGVKVVATELTRELANSRQFIDTIRDTVGWEVELLSKEDEGRCGAYGVLSSFDEVSGLFMDVGGGSTQISWLISENGEIKMSETPESLPYGALLLTYRLKNEDPKIVFQEIKHSYKMIMDRIKIPESLQKQALLKGGYDLYVCGGGFRGFGHLLLLQDPTYPISTIINGYSISFKEVESMSNLLFLKNSVPSLKPNSNEEIFRISKRRKQQLPLVGLLISAAFESLPQVNTVHFSQGGVREGVLYAMIPQQIRLEDPLITLTKPYAPLLTKDYLKLLRNALPAQVVPDEIYYKIAPLLCNLAFVHASYPKELQPTLALHVATTGIIAGSHGLSHKIRALIGLACCDRWGFDVPESEENFAVNLEKLIRQSDPTNGEMLIYWCRIIGKIMHVICGVHPGGNIRPGLINFRVLMNHPDDSNIDIMVELSPDDIKTSASVRGRIGSLQKKIKKMNKLYLVKNKVRIGVEYVDDPNEIMLM